MLSKNAFQIFNFNLLHETYCSYISRKRIILGHISRQLLYTKRKCTSFSKLSSLCFSRLPSLTHVKIYTRRSISSAVWNARVSSGLAPGTRRFRGASHDERKIVLIDNVSFQCVVALEGSTFFSDSALK